MKFCIFILQVLILFVAKASFAQEKASIITLSSNRKEDKSIDISFEKNDVGSVTVEMLFKELSNAHSNTKIYSVNGFRGTLLTLRPVNKEEHIGYSYTYRSIRGKLKPKIDPTFVYLLPYAAATELMVTEASFLNATYFGNTEPSDWKVYHFYTENPAIVTAARKGTVVEVIDRYDDEIHENAWYSSQSNRIMVEHSDGSLLEYGGFQKGSTKVKVGDIIFPGQEMGMNVKRGENRYSISFNLMYLKRADFSTNENKNMAETESFYGWVTPQFVTTEGTHQVGKNKKYTTLLDEGVVTKEMTKKELKKYSN